MNYRDEEDVFEEDVVFDQAGLLSSAQKRGKSAIRRVSGGRCAMLSKTLALCGAFFGLGLAFALPGPATTAPPSDYTDEDTHGEEYMYRCLGFMLGSVLGAVLLDRFNRLFLVFLALLVCSILVAMVPWTGITWLLRSDLILLGATMGFLLTGGNVLCLDLWGQNSRPFMQALHFSFSLGAFLAPLIARPLISPMAATMAPGTVHTRSPRAVNTADWFNASNADRFAERVQFQNASQQLQNLTATSAVPLQRSIVSQDTSVLPPLRAALQTDDNQSSTEILMKPEDSAYMTSNNLPFITSHNSTSLTGSTISPLIKNSSSSQSRANNNGTAVPAGHPGSIVSTISTSPLTPTSNTSAPLSTSSATSTVPTRSMNSPISTSSTKSASSTSNTGLFISTNSTNTSKSTEGIRIFASISSTTASLHLSHHKPKPPVNKGSNLDKSQDWDKVHVGYPPPEDVEIKPPVKAPASSTISTTGSTPTSTLSTKTNGSESIKVSNPTSAVTLRLPEKIFEKPINLSSTFNSANKAEQNVSVLNEPKMGEDVKQSTAVPKTTQPDRSKKYDFISASTTKHPDDVKTSTSPVSTPLPAAAILTSPSLFDPPSIPLPKSLTLTEKNSSTVVESPATSGTIPPDSPTSSTAPMTIPSHKSATNETHVEATSAPRRHHSKPSSYDNDIEEIHTVMDEVADRAKKYGLSRLQLSYLLVAILLLVASLLFLGFLCFNPRDPRSRSEEDVGGGRNNVIRPRFVRMLLTSLMMMVLAVSAGIQYSYGHLLVMFAIHSPLGLSYSTSSALTATFWGAVTSTRLACILLASALSPGALLVISVALTAVATWLMVALAAQSAVALWVGAVLVAVGTASVLPSSFLWMQQHVHVSHHVAGMLVMGPAMGDMMFPHLAERMMMDSDPAGLLHLSAVLSLGMIAFWILAYRVAHHPRNSLCNRADPAEHSYQLASQTDEDDLLDLTMSPVTHRDHGNASVAVSRRSAHANGNGVHRTGTGT